MFRFIPFILAFGFAIYFAKPCNAQTFLNGSFELNTINLYCQGVIDTSIFTNIFITKPNFTSYPWRTQRFFCQKPGIDTTSPCRLPYENLKMPLHGYTHAVLASNARDSDQLVLSFSAPLTIGRNYSIRWISTSDQRGFKVTDTVVYGLSTNKFKVEKQLIKHLPVDTIEAREYAISFSADSAFQYFIIYTKNDGIGGGSRALIDNFRLDTCLSFLPKRSIGCATYPLLLQAAKNGVQTLWNTYDTLPSITVTKNGIYTAHIYDSVGCVVIDSILVNTSPISAPSTHTTQKACIGDTLLLSSKYNAAYLWNTGNTSKQIAVTQNGVYAVYSLTTAGCDARDTFTVQFNSKTNFPSNTDTVICNNKPVVLSAYDPQFKTYLWNDNNTDSVRTIYTPGTYTIIASDGICSTLDTFQISASQVLSESIDTSFCQNDSIVLVAPVANTYLWNTGSTNPFIQVNTPGLYWVTKSIEQCSNIDSFNVSAIAKPFSSNTDTSVCENSIIQLTAQSAQSYLWSNGESAPTIAVNGKGNYWVIKNNSQCQGIDSFTITEKPLPIITSLSDTVVCFDQLAQILLDAGQFKSYLWKPTGETTRTIYSNAAQVYLLTVTDSNNCSMSKQVAVMETCPEFVFIPNAFTPNGDGVNDVFQVSTRSLESFELAIYNRWGQLVFETNDATKSWDGSEAPSDAYVYVLNYKVVGKPIVTTKGTVSLVR